MNQSLALTGFLLSFLAGLIGGAFLTPVYTVQRQEQSMNMDLGVTDSQLDKRYLNGMIAHHRTALDLAEQARQHSQREPVKKLAEEIIAADTKGIAELEAWKKEWYQDIQPVTNYPKIDLGGGDETFDLRFLNALITHHGEAITLNTNIQQKSSRQEIHTLARAVVNTLRAGQETLEQWRKEWYGF